MYYRKLWQNTASKQGSDAVGARTNNASPDWTAAVLGRTTALCTEIPGIPRIPQGVVWPKNIAGLVG